MPSLEESRARLIEHFRGDNVTKGSRWEELWSSEEFLPWDRQMPNPALVDLLAHCKFPLGSPVVQEGDNAGKRKRAFVPGCGRGYDVLLLASFGYDAYGLEISQSAVDRCKEEKKNSIAKYRVQDPGIGAGEASFIHGDFFADDWLMDAGGSEDFDLIYDYTFLACIPPPKRPKWALRTSQLLSSSGHLVCLEFPSAKDPKLDGPPWATPPPVYVALLDRPGEDVEYDDQTGHVRETPDRLKSAAALTRLAHWRPARTHKIGEGTDWISIWQHE